MGFFFPPPFFFGWLRWAFFPPSFGGLKTFRAFPLPCPTYPPPTETQQFGFFLWFAEPVFRVFHTFTWVFFSLKLLRFVLVLGPTSGQDSPRCLLVPLWPPSPVFFFLFLFPGRNSAFLQVAQVAWGVFCLFFIPQWAPHTVKTIWFGPLSYWVWLSLLPPGPWFPVLVFPFSPPPVPKNKEGNLSRAERMGRKGLGGYAIPFSYSCFFQFTCLLFPLSSLSFRVCFSVFAGLFPLLVDSTNLVFLSPGFFRPVKNNWRSPAYLRVGFSGGVLPFFGSPPLVKWPLCRPLFRFPPCSPKTPHPLLGPQPVVLLRSQPPCLVFLTPTLSPSVFSLRCSVFPFFSGNAFC